MKMILAALLLAIVTAHADTNLPTVRIDGQIYVTRKDRETVKMSLVTVRIIESNAAQAKVEQAREFLRMTRKAVADDKDWRKRNDALVEALPRMKPADAAQAKKTLAALRQLVTTNMPNVHPAIAKAKLADYLRLAVKDWPSVKEIQTDADGEFKAELPAGKWTIVASATRKIPGDEENIEVYFWIVPARAGERTLLNNSNSFDDDADDP